MYPRLEVWKRSDVRQLESSHLDVVFFGSLVDTALQRLSSFDVARAAVREVEEVGSVLARVEEFSWAQMAAEPKLDPYTDLELRDGPFTRPVSYT